MSEVDTTQISIIDQIIVTMIADIGKQEEFDNATLEKIKSLAKQRELTDLEKVAAAIEYKEEEQHEVVKP